MEATINNEKTTTGKRHFRILSRRHWGLKLILLPKILLLSNERKMLSSRGGFFTSPMYYHRQTIKYINIPSGNKENDSQLTDSQSYWQRQVEPQWAQLNTNTRRGCTRGIWKVLSMVFHLSNRFTNPIMFDIILKNDLSSMLWHKFHEDIMIQTRIISLWTHVLFVYWKMQNFSWKYNILPFEKCAEH